MRIVLYTNIISPHQMPLAKALVAHMGAESFRYIYTEAFHPERAQMGWQDNREPWCQEARAPKSREWMENADVMLSTNRDLSLFGIRAQRGRKTFYMSERWFKPPLGFLRILHPRYFTMAHSMVQLLQNGAVTYLPMGVHAASDMARLVRFASGDVRALLRPSRIQFERKPMGWVSGYDWMRMWGYFVEKGRGKKEGVRGADGNPLKVLWVGRMIGWKRVDTIIKAVKSLDKDKFVLTLVGKGDKRSELMKMADGTSNIIFKDSIPITQVRDVMRANDVYVLSSNGQEGWGAALNEALQEGMAVIGTFEAGSSATILNKSHLYHAGEWRDLATLIKALGDGGVAREDGSDAVQTWSAENAAGELLKVIL